MDKKLSAKVQKLNPVIPQISSGFSTSILIEPETKDLLLRKGVVYAVYGVTGEAGFDTTLINKVVHDVIHASYYQSDNISPIQSLERAVVEARDKVAQLPNEAIRQGTSAIRFDIVAGALWGNVLYVVQYGNFEAFLMRDGVVRDINTMSEGNFAAASGVVKDNDVIIFSTSAFNRDYPPQKLLTTSIPDQSLQPDQACLLMKLYIDTTFSKDELVDFGLEKAAQKTKQREEFSKIIGGVTTAVGAVKEKLAKRHMAITALGNSAITGKHTPGGLKKLVVIPIFASLLVLAILGTLKYKTQKFTEKPTTTPTTETKQAKQPNQPTQGEPPISDTAFYELKITDTQANPTELAVFTNYVIAIDPATGKIFKSARETPKFSALATTYPGVKSIANIEGKLAFLDTQGYKVMNLVTEKLEESYNQTGLLVAQPYLTYVYSLTGDTLTRYSKTGDTLKGTVWGESADFTGAKSFVVAYNVFILKADNTIVNYLSGNKVAFVVKGLETPLKDAVKLATNVDAKNIYIADKGNKRVVVLDKTGTFVKELKSKSVADWSDLRSLDISPDEKTLYVLNSSKVYEVKL